MVKPHSGRGWEQPRAGSPAECHHHDRSRDRAVLPGEHAGQMWAGTHEGPVSQKQVPTRPHSARRRAHLPSSCPAVAWSRALCGAGRPELLASSAGTAAWPTQHTLQRCVREPDQRGAAAVLPSEDGPRASLPAPGAGDSPGQPRQPPAAPVRASSQSPAPQLGEQQGGTAAARPPQGPAPGEPALVPPALPGHGSPPGATCWPAATAARPAEPCASCAASEEEARHFTLTRALSDMLPITSPGCSSGHRGRGPDLATQA